MMDTARAASVLNLDAKPQVKPGTGGAKAETGDNDICFYEALNRQVPARSQQAKAAGDRTKGEFLLPAEDMNGEAPAAGADEVQETAPDTGSKKPRILFSQFSEQLPGADEGDGATPLTRARIDIRTHTDARHQKAGASAREPAVQDAMGASGRIVDPTMEWAAAEDRPLHRLDREEGMVDMPDGEVAPKSEPVRDVLSLLREPTGDTAASIIQVQRTDTTQVAVRGEPVLRTDDRGDATQLVDATQRIDTMQRPDTLQTDAMQSPDTKQVVVRSEPVLRTDDPADAARPAPATRHTDTPQSTDAKQVPVRAEPGPPVDNWDGAIRSASAIKGFGVTQGIARSEPLLSLDNRGGATIRIGATQGAVAPLRIGVTQDADGAQVAVQGEPVPPSDGLGDAFVYRLNRADKRAGSRDIPAPDTVRQGQKTAPDITVNTVTVVDQRRYLAPAQDNALAVVNTIAGNKEWVAATQPQSGLANAAAIAGSGKVVNTLKIQMHPIDLGVVTATMRLVGEELSVELKVDNGAAYRKLKEDQSRIVEALKAQGFGVDQVSVVLAPERPDTSNGPSGNMQNGQGSGLAQQNQSRQGAQGQAPGRGNGGYQQETVLNGEALAKDGRSELGTAGGHRPAGSGHIYI